MEKPHPAVSSLPESQLRLVYSLLKPVVRAAARFHVPLRTLTELLRLAYFESLRRDGLSQAEIGRRLGQTERHMRSFERRLKGDFFAAEHEVGLAREIEDFVASKSPREADLRKTFDSWNPTEVQQVTDALLAEQRIVRADGERLQTGHRYVLLASDQFHRRIDALNHFLDTTYNAVVHRLIFDERQEAMIKTISFSTIPDRLRKFLTRVEGDLRKDISELERAAPRKSVDERRYAIGIALTPVSEDGQAEFPREQDTK